MSKNVTDKLTHEFKRNLKLILDERTDVTNPKRLSLDAGLGETAIRDILQNHSISPKLETVYKIARALKTPIYRLIPSMIDHSYERLAQKEEEIRLLREILNIEYKSLHDLEVMKDENKQ